MLQNFNKNNSLIIPIECSNKYYHILRLLKALPPFDKLGNREIEILSLIWKEYNEANIPKEKKYEYIFRGEDFKSKVCKTLNIKTSNYYNVLTNIRKKGFLGEKSIMYDTFISRLRDNIVFTITENNK